MRLFTRFTLAALLLIGPAKGLAQAVTVPELVALTKEGLSDEILIALIQTDGSVFQLNATDLLQLRKQGLSNAVIYAMQQTALKKPRPGRPTAPDTVPPDAAQPAPIVQEQVMTPGTPTPSVINVVQTVTQRVTPSPTIAPVIPVAVPIIVRPTRQEPPPPPQYWGWNGQRRPDTWQESTPAAIDPRTGKPVEKKGGGS